MLDYVYPTVVRGLVLPRLVFPSRGEGWGIPVLDSLARGTPVIASSLTAIPEAGGSAASYFDPDAPDRVDRLAELMGAAIEGRLPFDATAARAHAARHDWDGPAATFVDLMRRSFTARTHLRDLILAAPNLRG